MQLKSLIFQRERITLPGILDENQQAIEADLVALSGTQFAEYSQRVNAATSNTKKNVRKKDEDKAAIKAVCFAALHGLLEPGTMTPLFPCPEGTDREEFLSEMADTLPHSTIEFLHWEILRASKINNRLVEEIKKKLFREDPPGAISDKRSKPPQKTNHSLPASSP